MARVRRLLVVVVVAWLLTLAVRAIFAAWAVPRLADHEAQWRESVARLRERLENDTTPCLYRRLMETLDADQRTILLSSEKGIVNAADAGRVELPGGNQAAASVCARLSAALGTTTPEGDCYWNIHELVNRTSDQASDSLTLARTGAGCLAIEGNKLLAAGDVQAAYRHYAQSLRVGADLSAGDVLAYVTGIGIRGTAVDRL